MKSLSSFGWVISSGGGNDYRRCFRRASQTEADLGLCPALQLAICTPHAAFWHRHPSGGLAPAGRNDLSPLIPADARFDR